MGEEDKTQKNNLLHGLTLETILTDLVKYVGWEKMSEKISINCFSNNPTIKSSLSFLRKTPWARKKVEVMYEFNFKRIQKGKAEEA
ncbi:VF530 family DNA-binding protein [Pedobacter alpinus]|uniref:VF530 family DNA-binding protein n=1 Tax=Pedobacter alpinus TaxID=1590643 RepID=A0ABW5TLQ1_9SPHI